MAYKLRDIRYRSLKWRHPLSRSENSNLCP